LVEEALLSSQSQNQNLQDRMALLEQQISQTTQLLEQQLATTGRLLALREAGLALAQQQAKARQEAAQDDKAASVAAAPTTTTPTTTTPTTTTPTTTSPTTTTPTTTTPTTTNDTSPVVVGADDSAKQAGVGAGDKTTTALTVSTAVTGAQEKIVTPEAPRGLLAQWADSAATIPLVGVALAGGLGELGELGELGGLSDLEWGGNLNVAGVSVPVTWLLAITALLILLVLWRVRQRRAEEAYDDDEVFWADGVADADAQQAGGSDGEAEADVGVLSQDSIGSGFVAQTEAARGVSVTTDEVDPVAEADLYAAYGRVEQAIEVLRSAIRASPERIEFKVKLLEVLAQQGDAAAFEALAQEVSGLVETRSAEWTTISKFGRSLNPDNPLFGKVDSRTSDTALAPDEDGDVAAALPGLDLDAELDSMFKDTSTAPSPAAGLEPPAAPVNLDASAVAAPAESALGASALGASDAQVDRVGDVDDMGLDFDPAQAVIEVPEAPEPGEAEPSGDGEEAFDTIEFTLDDPLSDDGGDALAESSDSTGADDRDIEGKLDLARAYVEIGDQTAAIELLDEIDQQGTSAHKEVADALRKELTG
jgi:FimV-like protein